jgi:hypothetical protein
MSTTLPVRCALLLLVCASGCLELEFETRVDRQLADLQRKVVAQQARITDLEAQVNDGLGLALCTPELRTLLEDVQKECSTVTEHGPGMCTTKQIRPAVMNADPEHRGRFLKLMSHLPHEVVYIAQAATAILPGRIERVARLTRPVLLKNTVFLVVSSPETGEAEAVRRAEIVERLLYHYKIPKTVIHRWLYGFPANKADMVRQSDQPFLSEPKDLSRGVWVFRADC